MMLDFLKSNLILVKLAGFTVALLCSAYGGYHYRDLSADSDMQAAQLAQSKALLRATEAAATKQTEWANQSQEAQNAAKQREITLRLAADSSRRSADSMRQQLADNQQRLSSFTADAVAQYASTVSNVLNDCAADYRSLAETSDRHVSDIQTLIQAWPK